jgi:hypothetical protein
MFSVGSDRRRVQAIRQHQGSGVRRQNRLPVMTIVVATIVRAARRLQDYFLANAVTGQRFVVCAALTGMGMPAAVNTGVPVTARKGNFSMIDIIITRSIQLPAASPYSL